MIKTFVIHVSKGYEERRKHIDKHLPERGITDYEYMLRGDIDDLSDAIRNEFFDDSLRLPEKSCFYKHYLVMKKVVEEQIPHVLVLEDDAILAKNFLDELLEALDEVSEESNYFVNIEDAATSVPFSLRIPGQRLYRSKTNKLCGGYVYDLSFATRMVTYIETNTIDAPIDGLIGNVRSELGYNIFWCQPPLVSQGSKNGMFASELNGAKSGLYIRLRSAIKDFYRRDIRSHLSKKHKALFQNINKY
ncbi:glycosyltransferase family 25 protein [Vibrio genomosp. F10]|uniref:glycosyltransferase family 25 protein n=1 Tax=Vibrio genomosp. F10 TaxID=723171 RepID=UPI0002EE9C75|nr:glycosyltransferase family 25 protein [Vibrio genomosp. F10]OEF04556.1 3-deoxy-D-manno-octulosonic acid transferase [Vibrio genomosp. F10 str. 9ZB36]